MEDFKKELALLLETYQVALVARVHHYGDNKTTGMVVFQDYTGTVESNTGVTQGLTSTPVIEK